MVIPMSTRSSPRFRNAFTQPALSTENTMDEKRIARRCGLTLTGLFAVSLILSAKAI